MNRHIVFSLLVALVAGCRSTWQAEGPAGPHIRVLTYNVNWGAPGLDIAADIIRQSGADIVCLQETTPQWEPFLRRELASNYAFVEFRNSKMRMGGGLAFLAKVPAREVAYIPSETGWFDGWIMGFDTAIGPVQVLNVHLRPPVSDRGNWVSGYLFTGDDRLREMERFYVRRRTGAPMLVAGDFNDTRKAAWLSGWRARECLTPCLNSIATRLRGSIAAAWSVCGVAWITLSIRGSCIAARLGSCGRALRTISPSRRCSQRPIDCVLRKPFFEQAR